MRGDAIAQLASKYMGDSFYVTLTSKNSHNEYPANAANRFKYPYTLRFEGAGWKVGLSSISLPDTALNLVKLSALTAPLLQARWLNVGHADKESTSLTFADIKNGDNIVDGVTFMKALAMKYQQVVNYKRNVNGKLFTSNGERLELVFGWEGEDLILDNSQLDLTKITGKNTPIYYIMFNQTLVEEIGLDKKETWPASRLRHRLEHEIRLSKRCTST